MPINNNKILLLTEYLPFPICGGAGVYIRELFSRFPKDEVTALVGMRDQKAGVSVDGSLTIYRNADLYLPIKGFNKYGLVRNVCLWILYAHALHKKNRFSLIVCGEFFPSGFVGLMFRYIFRIPYVIIFHGEEIYKVSGWRKVLMSIIMSHANRFISNSENTKRLISELNSDKEIIVCKPCVDFNIFRPSSNVELLKKELGLNNKKIILTVARMLPRKGHKLAISALEKIIKIHSNTVLVVIGQDFGYGQKIKEHIINCNVQDSVILKGVVSDHDLVKYYQVCDVFVMVSDMGENNNDIEGFGITFLEASACEKPVICGNSGGMPEAVEDGQTGFIVDPADEKKFIKTLLMLLENPLKSKIIGANGRRRILESFDYTLRSQFLRVQLNDLFE